MTPTTHRSIWSLVRRQHGVVSVGQLRGFGFGREAIRHRVAIGRLHPVARGVYAVGRPQLTREGRWMAALLASGEGAVLSHGSAAALWGFGREPAGWIEVSARSASARRRPGLHVRRRPTLRAEEVTARDGIPVTSVSLTLVDLAARHRDETLERMVSEADRLDLIDPERLRASLRLHRGRRGVAGLRLLLDRLSFRLSASELEQRLLAIVRAGDLPFPETRRYANGHEVDFLWPELGLVVESDGLRYHRTPMTQLRDRRRDHAHVAAGLTQLRFADYQVRYEPEYVAATLRRTIHSSS
jgi:very-short-patch-repair endonuclease